MSETSTPRRFGTIAEAASFARCSPRTIRRRIEDGTLTGYKFGPRLIRVDLDELDVAVGASVAEAS